MRNLASITSAGWICSLLLVILVLLSACLPSPERVETTPYPARLTLELASSVSPTRAVTCGPVLASPLEMATVEPSQTVAQSEITPTPSEGKTEAVMITVVYRLGVCLSDRDRGEDYSLRHRRRWGQAAAEYDNAGG